jgi:AraC family transcriptional regulator
MSTQTAQFEPTRFEDGRALLIAGLSQCYSMSSISAIPLQWQRFAPYLGNIPGQIGGVNYGVCFNRDEAGNFDYLTGVEAAGPALPKEFSQVHVPAQRYAVFVHGGHVSAIPELFRSIWGDWLPRSGCEIAPTPLFERYSEAFDPVAGVGGMEIWIPINN